MPAGDYELSEVPTPGDEPAEAAEYRPADWSCTGGDLTPGASGTATGTVTVEAGADVVCTIVNRFLPPHLTLAKSVLGGGPAPEASDWELSYENTANGRAGSGTTGTDPVTDVAVGTGTVILREEVLEGYTPGEWTCEGAVNEPVPAGPGTAELELTAEDAEVSCEIVNEWTGAQLTLVKEVADGGLTPAIPGSAEDWTLSAEGTAGGLVVDGSGSGMLAPGTYELSETPNTEVDPDYHPGIWECEGEGFELSATEPGLGSLRLETAAEVTCTLRNLFQPPHLTLEKAVEGGPLDSPEDWTLQFEGEAGVAGSGRTGDAEITGVAVGAGTYTLAEVPTQAGADISGYTTEGWVCDSLEPPVAGPDGTATLTLGPEDRDVTCTIENIWQGASLTLVKTVDGGTAAPGDWTLAARDAQGATAIEGTSGQPAVTEAPVPVGSYILSESPVPGAPTEGYVAEGWECRGALLSGEVVTLAAGDEAVCTVTNRAADAPPPGPGDPPGPAPGPDDPAPDPGMEPGADPGAGPPPGAGPRHCPECADLPALGTDVRAQLALAALVLLLGALLVAGRMRLRRSRGG